MTTEITPRASAPADPVRLEVPDASDYWTRMVKCQDACPVHTDACGYVNAIGEGRYPDAYRIARATNPFASICGRVCGAPCEANCRRGAVDRPVSIRALKRFVTDRFGPETGDYAVHRDGCDVRMLPPGSGNGERIAVVGAGVAGLTVAHDLSRIGYRVTVFEADAEPGGMLTAGVPIFRLPRELVRHEINAILSLGVELKCGVRLGTDFSIESLRREGYRAIFLGIGLPRGRKLAIPGADLNGVYDGLEFLRAFNAGKPMPLGRRVIVIGGGNVAYDVARSAVRPVEMETGDEESVEIERGEKIAYDVARSALRMSGDKSVHVVCLERRHEMPADPREIEEGEEEGLHLHSQRGPVEVIGKNGKVTGLKTVHCVSVFDAEGRFRPVFDEAVTEVIEGDTVMFAIGQTSDLSFLAPEDGVESERGLIKVDPVTYQTTAPDVFACGDIAHGPRLFIHAIASAQVAARSMHDFLRRTRTDVVVRRSWKPAAYTMAPGWEQLQRREPPVVEPATRSASNVIVEECFPEVEARRQASRCLRCNVNTIFDTGKCVACNGCVDVCPMNLIRLVQLSRLEGADRWTELAAGALGVSTETLMGMPPESLNALGAVMLKDESTCIRCAMCATRCPTHAITMQTFEHHRECVTVPAPNPRLRYEAGSVSS